MEAIFEKIYTVNGEKDYIPISEILSIIKEKHIEFLDLKFSDLFGRFQHYTLTADKADEDLFSVGTGFDGSSIRGFQKINESDMLMRPDPSTAFIDPFFDHRTLSFICDIIDPVKRERYPKDPRFIGQKTIEYLRSTGIADTAYFGPEPEFFIFDSVKYDQTHNKAFYEVDSSEAYWNAGKETENLGYKIPYKQGYFPTSPHDQLHNLRSKMVEILRSCGIQVNLHHHEVATAGQTEIGLEVSDLVHQADTLLHYKYIIKNVAHRYNKTVTFMPKPIFMDNGSGMHIHISLWKEGTNTFYSFGNYADLSETAQYFIGGLFSHIKAVLAFAAPITNSYRRLVPGYEAPINLVYSARNRSAAVRIPMYSASEKAKRIEFRCPDPSCNPYLAFSAMIMAGIDGILNKITPPPPIDDDIYELTPEEKAGIRSTPGSLKEVIDGLEEDYGFLLEGNVFSEALIGSYISYKRKNEIDQVALRPHPWEYSLYYEI
ncbi:MAG: type I glutamate--ammonia ligase [Spirochaetales bacterium]|nr:type I glutamate--ammonia ligase [Spirochaetales bacterium]